MSLFVVFLVLWRLSAGGCILLLDWFLVVLVLASVLAVFWCRLGLSFFMFRFSRVLRFGSGWLLGLGVFPSSFFYFFCGVLPSYFFAFWMTFVIVLLIR